MYQRGAAYALEPSRDRVLYGTVLYYSSVVMHSATLELEDTRLVTRLRCFVEILHTYSVQCLDKVRINLSMLRFYNLLTANRVEREARLFGCAVWNIATNPL